MGGSAMRQALGALIVPVVVALTVGLAAPASADDPTIQVSKGSAAPGETVIVTLGGWPSTATVTVCGNEARRGAVDCDQAGGVGLAASLDRPQQRELVLTTPPAKCPCVLRAATAGEQLVRTVPIDLIGVPSVPVTGPLETEGRLRVSARLVDGSSSAFDRLKSSLGGPTRRTLVLRLTNTGTTPLSGISVSAAVARDPQGGDPLQPPNVEPLVPGEVRPYNLSVRLSPPSYGSYVVFGTVYGAGTPVSFSVMTSTTPWALLVLLVLLVADLVAIGTLRIRRRRQRAATLPEAQPV